MEKITDKEAKKNVGRVYDAIYSSPVKSHPDLTQIEQLKKGSMRQSLEAPVLVVFERKREVLVNYRVAEDMYIVDKVFDTGALIVGTGSVQDRVVLKRLKGR